jgi:hypothetical protein
MTTTKYLLLLSMLTIIYSCRTATERWVDGMADFRETGNKDLNLQVARLKKQIRDTVALDYKVRIYLHGKATEARGYDANLNFYYHMDSCFSVKADGREFLPVIVQPVNNGIANCYEYLLSFRVDPAIRLRTLEFVYRDRFVDGKKYELNLN